MNWLFLLRRPSPATYNDANLSEFVNTDAGVPVRHLRKIAGHGSLAATQRYLHSDRDSVSNAAALLSKHLVHRWPPAKVSWCMGWAIVRAAESEPDRGSHASGARQ